MVPKQMGAKLRFDALKQSWSDEDVKRLELDIEH